MRRCVIVPIFVLMVIIMPLAATEGRYLGTFSDISEVNGNKVFNKDAEATMTATISADVIGKWLEIGFAKTTDIGNYYDNAGKEEYLFPDGSSITLDDSVSDLDSSLDGVATGPNDLYIYYKVLDQEPLTISVSLDKHLEGEHNDIPWYVDLEDLEATDGFENLQIASDGTKSETICRHTSDSDNLEVGIYKAEIRTRSYESIDVDGGNIPSDTYTANLTITITNVGN